MSDKELLELSAKAAGICPHTEVVIERWEDGNDAGSDHSCKACGKDPYPKWNPLKDDGDALRLAIKLGINISMEDKGAWIRYPHSQGKLLEEYWGDAGCVDHRYAIVMVAAAISKETK